MSRHGTIHSLCMQIYFFFYSWTHDKHVCEFVIQNELEILYRIVILGGRFLNVQFTFMTIFFSLNDNNVPINYKMIQLTIVEIVW